MGKKKKKKYHAMPKLSFLDQCVYGLLLVVSLIPCGLCVYAAIGLRNRITFAEEGVVAAVAHGSLFWCFPAFIWLLSLALGCWAEVHGKRYPIFGKRGVKYGPPAYPKIYPLFMKNKPKVWVSQRARENRKTCALFLLAVTVLLCLLVPLSVAGRDVLYADGRIGAYNMFGVQTEAVDKPFVEQVEFGVYVSSSGRTSTKSYGVDVTLWTADGEKYRFEDGDFRHDWDAEVRLWITDMLALKEAYAGRVTWEEGAVLDRVLDGRSDRERALILELFGQTE